ncbi:MAG: hypothetical protein JOZ27_07250, partial [Caulobacteraceae bacterium]|nr:hypothetical protein [Caulobacteraceae bacterium]
MFLRNLAIRSAAVTALTLAVAGPSHAFGYFTLGATSGPSPGDPGVGPGENVVVSFDGPNAPGVTETDSGSVGLWTGLTPNVAAPPTGDTTQYEAIQPGGAAVFDFSGY